VVPEILFAEEFAFLRGGRRQFVFLVLLVKTDYGGRDDALRGHDPRFRDLLRRALELIGRQALHAHRLAFNHPVSGERLDFTAPLPQDFREVLELLRQGAGMNLDGKGES